MDSARRDYLRRRLAADLNRLLVTRTRTALWIVLGSVAVFTTADILTGRSGWLLMAISLIQIALAAAGLLFLRSERALAWAVGTPLVIVLLLYLTTAVSTLGSDDTITMQLLFVVIALGTASLLPWGIRPQIVSVVGAAFFGLGALALEGWPTAPTGYPTVAMGVAFAVSVIAAREVERYTVALEERTLALAEAQELANVGSWEWCIADDRVVWSDQMCQVFGVAPERLSGSHEAYLERVHPEDRERVCETIARALSTGAPFSSDERIIRPDGIVRVIHTRGEVLMGEDGRPTRMLGTCQDVTERERVREEIARARDLAIEASTMKSVFLANVSHEIRTPLNVIVGYNEFLGEALAARDDPTLSEYREAIDRASRRLVRTVQAVLDFSRIEAGDFETHPVAVNLLEEIPRRVEAARAFASQRDLSISFDTGLRGAVVPFDPQCFSGALEGLLDNAVKFTQRGEVRVGLHGRDDGTLELEIRDTGVGIDPHFLPRLFEPFIQEDSGHARRFEGAGLGLALARRYLELNGATLLVESEKGKGSCFTICFPGADGPLAPTAGLRA